MLNTSVTNSVSSVSSTNSDLAVLFSPFRTFKDVNRGIRAGYIKTRCMSKVTLYTEQRPRFRPVVKNHWACYMSGNEQVTEIAVHPDGITIKVWEKDLNGTAFVAESHNIGLDINLLWARFETDIRSGRAQLSDDSSTFQRFLSRATPMKEGYSLIARRDGISLMIKWIRRQERYIIRQQNKLVDELNSVAKAIGSASGGLCGYADFEDTLSEEAQNARSARAAAIRTEATLKALVFRGTTMPSSKREEVLDCAPATLNVKQSSMNKTEGGYTAGVGGKGQLDRFRAAPRGSMSGKAQAKAILSDMADRQFRRAEAALNEGRIEEAEYLFAQAAQTEAKANNL